MARRRRAHATCSGREGEERAAGGGRDVMERWPPVGIEDREFEMEAARSVRLWSEKRGQNGIAKQNRWIQGSGSSIIRKTK